MLTWFRRKARGLAATLLVSLGAIGLSLLAPHPLDCHGTDCGVTALHDAAAHQVSADTSGPAGEPFHCLACHWARSFRPQIASRIVSAPVRERSIRIFHELVTVTATAPVAQPPLRSPPAVVL